MRFKLWVLIIALAAVVSVPVAAQADDAKTARLKALQERLLALEDKVDERHATIETNRQLLEQASRNGELPAVGQGIGLDGFFSSLEFGGHVTGSYTYAFNNPSQTTRGTGAAVTSQPLNQFNARHNTFELDAVKLELGKSTNGPGTAGFQIDLLMGNNSQILNGITSGLATSAVAPIGASDNGIHIQEAYAVYNWRGADIKLGKFETLLGYEVLDSPYNPNISHGLLYTWAIPLFHTGVLASGDFDENWGYAIGLTNGFNNSTDLNENKGYLAQLRYGNGPLSASFQTYYGADRAKTPPTPPASALGTTTQHITDDQLILDFVATYAASDSLSFWLNADWGEQEDLFVLNGGGGAVNDDTEWWGVAIGTKMNLSPKLTFALRGEYLEDEKASRILGVLQPAGLLFPPDDAELTSLTGTLGYAMTDNLSTRLELRWDQVDLRGTADRIFPDGTNAVDFDDEALTGYLEVSYSFD